MDARRDEVMTMANTNKIKVTFLHNRASTNFPVELGPATTGQKALDELVKANFIEAANGGVTYALHLQRTNATLPLAAPLASSGVEDGDTIAITETSKGARA